MKFTPTEKEALEVFRRRASQISENTEDEFLIRWLRARELDLDRAEAMLKDCLEWRKAENVEEALHFEASEEVTENICFEKGGYDPEGRPIFIAPIGTCELRKLISRGLKNECLQRLRRLMEEACGAVEAKKAEGVTQFVAIFDMSGLTFWKIAHLETINALKTYFREFEAYYPELLYRCYIINAPRAFAYIFNIVKPFLTMRTLGKVKIYDSGPKWRKEINEDLPTASLPSEYKMTVFAQ